MKHFLKHKNYGYLTDDYHLRVWGRRERKNIYAHYAYCLLLHSHVSQSELAFKLSGAVCSRLLNTVTILKREDGREIICSSLKCTQVPKNFLSKPVWYECVIAITITANCQLWIFSQFYRLSFCLLLHQCRILKQISRGSISSYLLCKKIDWLYLWHSEIHQEGFLAYEPIQPMSGMEQGINCWNSYTSPPGKLAYSLLESYLSCCQKYQIRTAADLHHCDKDISLWYSAT